jgi:hypothetical protein
MMSDFEKFFKSANGRLKRRIFALLFSVSATFTCIPPFSVSFTCYQCHLMTSTLILKHKKKNSVAFVRKRTITTVQPSLVGEVNANFFADRGCRVVSATDPHVQDAGCLQACTIPLTFRVNYHLLHITNYILEILLRSPTPSFYSVYKEIKIVLWLYNSHKWQSSCSCFLNSACEIHMCRYRKSLSWLFSQSL